MPYVRQHGRQLVLVHGVRNAKTGQVEQRELFTLHSKPEALEAIGKGKAENARLFRCLVEAQFPELSFRWKELARAILEKLHVLPDTYEYAASRVRTNFRKSLAAFAAQLAHADPQSLLSAAQVIKDHRHELEWLQDLIKWRLKLSNTRPNRWNVDNEYFWRFALRGSEVPADALEHAASLFEKGKYDQAAALFRLFLDAFGEDADAHNFLGLIAIEEGQTDDAIAEFRKTIDLGRRSVPKRISKKVFQEGFRARPYLRGLTNLASALNLKGDFKEALSLLDHLDAECGDDFTANSWRTIVHLNTGAWDLAAKAAHGFQVVPAESLPASLAFRELDRLDDSAMHALHAALNNPRASRMLHGLRVEKPKSATEAQDWNEGVHLCRHLQAYLECRTRQSKDFFRTFLQHPRVVALQRQVEDAEAVWRTSKNREGFATMNRLRSLEFARLEGPQLLENSRRGDINGTCS